MAIDTIGTNAIANDAVTAAKIPAGAVDADITTIPDGSVTTAKLAADAVTTAKLAADAVTNAKVADDAVQTENVASGVNLGRRNLAINGNFQIWQRGTTWSSSVNRYVMDRWYQWGNTGIPSQITGANGSQYGARLQHNQAGTTFSAWSMTLEKKDIRHTIGKNLTLSFYAKKGTAFTGEMKIQIVARTDTEDKINSGTNVTLFNTDIASSMSTANWTKFTFTTTSVVPTTEVVGINFWHNNTSGTDANNYFDLSQVQLEVGDTATDFEHLGYGEELALCQRYYWQSSDIRFFNYGGAGQVHCTMSNPVPMRTTPTVVWYPSVVNLNARTSGGLCTKDGTGNVAVSTLQTNAQHTSCYVGSGQGANHRVARTVDAEI